jgi:hypothetical protein
MENGEPQVSQIDAVYSNGSFDITAEVEHTRNCSDCGTELKSISHGMEISVNLADMEEFKKLSADDQKKLLAALENGKAEVECSDDGSGDAEESGGGRYAKNIITVRVNYELTISFDKIELTHSGELEEQSPASAYDECC